MYDEKDNRYLDCVNNVTHGRCCVILYYFIWFWVFWLYQCMVFNYSTLGFISLQSVIFPVTKRLFYSEAWGELVLIQTSLYFTMNLNCTVILLTTSHSKLAQVIGYLCGKFKVFTGKCQVWLDVLTGFLCYNVKYENIFT